MVEQFQRTVMALRYSRIPTICAVQGLVLGGGCEILMHCDHAVAALESYIGLVEVGVGLIPAAGGSKELALRAYQKTKEVGQRYQWIEKFFKQIAMAAVSGSAYEAQSLGYLRESDTILMNPNELLYVAQQYGKAFLEAGYRPPLPPKISVGGWQSFANLQTILINMGAGRFISEHDHLIGTHLARVLSGGELDHDTLVPESWFLQLELDAFLTLAQTDKTWARVEHTLKTGKPLRN
jgi:3-hydroxyacyl-CoA dehydrogenase